MNGTAKRFTILVADDDADDRALIREALEEIDRPCKVHCVEDGEQLLNYLYHRDHYATQGAAPLPDLILLDLNMPRKDGREALREIKADDHLRFIPIVIFSTSNSPEDVHAAYVIGANSYIPKPHSFQELVIALDQLGKYWFDIVVLEDAMMAAALPS